MGSRKTNQTEQTTKGEKCQMIHTRQDRQIVDDLFENVLRFTNSPDLMQRLVALGQFELLVNISRTGGIKTKWIDTLEYKKAFTEYPTIRHLYKVVRNGSES